MGLSSLGIPKPGEFWKGRQIPTTPNRSLTIEVPQGANPRKCYNIGTFHCQVKSVAIALQSVDYDFLGITMVVEPQSGEEPPIAHPKGANKERDLPSSLGWISRDE